MVYRWLLAVLSLFILLSACGAPARHRVDSDDRLSKSDRQRLVSVAGSYLGSPYRYGGTSVKGFDCSGLVYRIYRQALRWKIPRTTRGQYDRTILVNSGKAKPGDLVFFRIRGARIDHVGMMISNYQFIHSSTSKGVIVSDFGEEYYRVYFSSIRRFK
jgi:cell wall-associated NlpC family hydrolase